MVQNSKNVALIVAHPDDETLWAGGTILSHPRWNWFILCLCRKSDKDRAPRFHKVLKVFKSGGTMCDLDDGPEQKPLDETELDCAILDFLPQEHFDLIITHNPWGEYTKHVRHEETGKAVIRLWLAGRIKANELWTFAYEDGGRKYYPRPVETAAIFSVLTNQIWLKKYRIITEIYGFQKNSFEAETTPKAEAFWQFFNACDAKNWFNQSDNKIN